MNKSPFQEFCLQKLLSVFLRCIVTVRCVIEGHREQKPHTDTYIDVNIL